MSAETENIKEGDYVCFEWPFGFLGPELVVASITSVYPDKVLVHFLYGYKSESEFVQKDDIIAIGDLKSNGKIKGWGGTFNILKPDHSLLLNQ